MNRHPIYYFSQWYSAAQMRRHLKRGIRIAPPRIDRAVLDHDHRPVQDEGRKPGLVRRLLGRVFRRKV